MSIFLGKYVLILSNIELLQSILEFWRIMVIKGKYA